MKLINTSLLTSLEAQARTREEVLNWVQDVARNGWVIPRGEMSINIKGAPAPIISAIESYLNSHLQTILLAARDDFNDKHEELLTKVALEADEIKARVQAERSKT